MRYKYLAWFGIIFLASTLDAQDLQPLPPAKPHLSSFSVSEQNTRVRTESLITAVAIKSSEESEFFLTQEESTIAIPLDPDAENFTYFLSLANPTYTVEIESSASNYELYLIHTGSVTHKKPSKARTDDTCDPEINPISQEVWRSGLPAPSYSRNFTTVRHNIIHHSAGSNTNTNFTQVVRDIYVYHTEVNGWSDIGYNYLIAQDGTLFAGRDPDTGDQLTVMGAHFCGRNSNTTGFCVLGNYETATVSSDALTTLQELLVFSNQQSMLDPLEEYAHATGTLDVISGHRDGCATLCPGENLYGLLTQLRLDVKAQMEDCLDVSELRIAVDEGEIERGSTLEFVNESSGYESYKWIFEGGFPAVSYVSRGSFVQYFESGEFDVTLIGDPGETADTLYLPDFVKVIDGENSPLLYPNPLSPFDIVRIDFDEQPSTISIYTAMGVLVAEVGSELDIPALDTGIYLLKITSRSGIYTRKLIVY